MQCRWREGCSRNASHVVVGELSGSIYPPTQVTWYLCDDHFQRFDEGLEIAQREAPDVKTKVLFRL